MTHRRITLAAAAAWTFGTLAAASASGALAADAVDRTFSTPTVVGAAYHVQGVALNAADVRKQGGLLVPNLTRWQRVPDAEASAEPFRTPIAFSVAYRNRMIATDAAQVLRQGGFATAGVVRWLPDAPATVEVDAGIVKLGAL